MTEPAQYDVAIVGGGLAGIAAAMALAKQNRKVLLLEARPRLGGRASSFQDPISGQLVDVCQHVVLGCCSHFMEFLKEIGIAYYLTPQPKLYFLTPDGKQTTWQASRWLPSPLHYASSFLRSHFLSFQSKRCIATAMLKLKSLPADHDEPLLNWLLKQKQTQQALDRFWSPVLVSALNETLDNAGLKYARKVFVDGMFHSAAAGLMYLPNVPLGQFYGKELNDWLTKHQVEVRLSTAVKEVTVEGNSITGLRLRTGNSVTAKQYVLAVPSERITSLFSKEALNQYPELNYSESLQTSPITSIHLWHDQPITQLPHVVLLDRISQWLFNRGETNRGEWYTQIVVSASRNLLQMKNDEIETLIVKELKEYFHTARSAKLLRAKVITEQHATFSAVPQIDQHRPDAAIQIPNLYLAGDWTQTGWPGTMEGAIRSGQLAAQSSMMSF